MYAHGPDITRGTSANSVELREGAEVHPKRQVLARRQNKPARRGCYPEQMSTTAETMDLGPQIARMAQKGDGDWTGKGSGSQSRAPQICGNMPNVGGYEANGTYHGSQPPDDRIVALGERV